MRVVARPTLAFALLLVTAVVAAKPPEKSPEKPKGVRAVDWRNFTYPDPNPTCQACLGGGPIKLVNGRSTPDELFPDLEAFLVRVTYADVAGDDDEEALIEVYRRFSPKGYTRRFYLYAFGTGLRIVWQGYSLSYEGELSGVVSVNLARRGFGADEVDAAGRAFRATYAGTIEGTARLVKRVQVKPRRK